LAYAVFPPYQLKGYIGALTTGEPRPIRCQIVLPAKPFEHLYAGRARDTQALAADHYRQRAQLRGAERCESDLPNLLHAGRRAAMGAAGAVVLGLVAVERTR
jgi:hypothetical protein